MTKGQSSPINTGFSRYCRLWCGSLRQQRNNDTGTQDVQKICLHIQNETCLSPSGLTTHIKTDHLEVPIVRQGKPVLFNILP